VEASHSQSDVDLILSPANSLVPKELVEEMVVEDDRNLVTQGDRVLMVVEDDATFARIMIDVAHSRGVKVVVAMRGSTAISLAQEFEPAAITLDVRLPDHERLDASGPLEARRADGFHSRPRDLRTRK